MRSLKTLLFVALFAFGANAMAQDKVVDRVNQRTVKEFDHQDISYEFQKHWFLNLMGGAQYTLGEAKFDKLISPNVQLGLGYQFSPVFGMRLQANAWQSKGGWNGYVPTQGATPYTEDYKYKYVAPGLDFMFNLSNLFCGWNPKRVFNVVAFLGGGANIAWANDEVNEIGAHLANKENYELEYLWDGTKVRPFGRGGIDLMFRLSNAVSLLVEGNANILSDHYNSKKAGNADWYFNALVGLKINLGKDTKTIATDVYRDVVVYDTIWKDAPKPVVEKIEPIRRDVFFTINSTVIVEEEMAKVEDIANFMKKYPNAKVVVSGYADKGTGNARINARLAAQRADVVVKCLKEKFGIAEDRITYDSYGDTVQPFAENDLNRVSICIANPE